MASTEPTVERAVADDIEHLVEIDDRLMRIEAGVRSLRLQNLEHLRELVSRQSQPAA